MTFLFGMILFLIFSFYLQQLILIIITYFLKKQKRSVGIKDSEIIDDNFDFDTLILNQPTYNHRTKNDAVEQLQSIKNTKYNRDKSDSRNDINHNEIIDEESTQKEIIHLVTKYKHNEIFVLNTYVINQKLC